MNRRDLFKLLGGASAAAEVTEIKTGELTPNSIIVMRAPGRISAEVAQRIREGVEKLLPHHKVMVLGDGLDVQVLNVGPHPIFGPGGTEQFERRVYAAINRAVRRGSIPTQRCSYEKIPPVPAPRAL